MLQKHPQNAQSADMMSIKLKDQYKVPHNTAIIRARGRYLNFLSALGVVLKFNVESNLVLIVTYH